MKNDYTKKPESFKNGKARTYRDTRPSGEARHTRFEESAENIIYGRNAVRELLSSGRDIDKIFVKRGEPTGSITALVATALERKIPVIEVADSKLDELSGGGAHQGIVASASEKEYSSVEDILKNAEAAGHAPLLVIADGIVDPNNLGALIRSAECAGADGVIIPKRRSATLTAAVSKASAGALQHMPIARVANLAATVDGLKKAGVWIFAAEADGKSYTDVDLTGPAAVILGSEGDGVSRLLKEKSDFIVSIPMFGQVNSLNVSAAAAVILTHAAIMRNKKA